VQEFLLKGFTFFSVYRIENKWRPCSQASILARNFRIKTALNVQHVCQYVTCIYNLKNSLIIHEENTKKNHKRVVYVITMM
jgi:hypothetical protein